MGFNSLEQKEKVMVVASLLFVSIVFSVAVYQSVNPQVKVWEATIFETNVKEETTMLMSRGQGFLAVPTTEYIFEEGETYRITYLMEKKNKAEKILSIEKIS